jgi:hypothetical protein
MTPADTGSHAARQRRYPRQHECGCRPGLHERRARRDLLRARGLGAIGFPEGTGVADFSGHATAFSIPANQQQQFGAPNHRQLVTNHDVTARRDGIAWLVAQGGTAAQRVRLLAALTVTKSQHP